MRPRACVTASLHGIVWLFDMYLIEVESAELPFLWSGFKDLCLLQAPKQSPMIGCGSECGCQEQYAYCMFPIQLRVLHLDYWDFERLWGRERALSGCCWVNLSTHLLSSLFPPIKNKRLTLCSGFLNSPPFEMKMGEGWEGSTANVRRTLFSRESIP